MIFNEYTDILESGEVIFFDKENMFQTMLEAGEATTGPAMPSGVDGTPSADGTTADSTPAGDAKTKENSSRLVGFFKEQLAKFQGFAKDQGTKMAAKIDGFKQQISSMPASESVNDEEIEMPGAGAEPSPKMERVNGDDPNLFQKAYGAFKERINIFNTNVDNKLASGKKIVKGGAKIAGAMWLFSQIKKMSGDIDVNFKDIHYSTS